MTTVAIMQPTYIPWAGYFQMINQADIFILLDTVPIDRKSWQTRNIIQHPDGRQQWLTIPTHAHQGQPLNTIQIADEHDWRTKHQRAIHHAYGHLPHYQTITPIIRLLKQPITNLTNLTSWIIGRTAQELRIITPIIRTSELGYQQEPPHSNSRIERIAAILHDTNAAEFLATPGATFLHHHTHIDGIPIRYIQYHDHPKLSILHTLAHHGPTG